MARARDEEDEFLQAVPQDATMKVWQTEVLLWRHQERLGKFIPRWMFVALADMSAKQICEEPLFHTISEIKEYLQQISRVTKSILDIARSVHGRTRRIWQSRSLTCVHIVGDSHCKTTDGGTPQNKLEEQRYRNKFQDKPEHTEEDENLSHLYRFLVLALLALFLVSSVSSFCLQDTITQPSELRSLLPSLDPWISTTFTVLSAI